jgi:hypothetical protein
MCMSIYIYNLFLKNNLKEWMILFVEETKCWPPTLTNKDGYHPNRAVSCRVELLHHSNTLEGTRIQKPGIEPTTTQI